MAIRGKIYAQTHKKGTKYLMQKFKHKSYFCENAIVAAAKRAFTISDGISAFLVPKARSKHFAESKIGKATDKTFVAASKNTAR